MNGHSSSCSQVISGVPRDPSWVPLLLICYINDLPKETDSTIKLYADDVLLFRVLHWVADHEIATTRTFRHSWLINWKGG